jgi:hypothetical protein
MSDGLTRQHREHGRGDDDAELGDIGENLEHQGTNVWKVKRVAAVMGV